MSDPAALRAPTMVRFFGGVMARAVRRNFHAVRLAAPGWPELPPDRPVIVYLNHPSWWDPAFLIVLARTGFAERIGFGPIDETMLARYRFMARIGLFGVEPGTATGGIRFLRTSLRLLANRRAMLWITAEGAMTDPRVRPLRLRPGLAHLVRHAPQATVVPLALEYPFWEERTPEALARFGTPVPGPLFEGQSHEEVAARLADLLEYTMDALAEDALSRAPTRFTRLQTGTAGIGGVYDLWRRGRAWAAGERFRPEHGAPEA